MDPSKCPESNLLVEILLKLNSVVVEIENNFTSQASTNSNTLYVPKRHLIHRSYNILLPVEEKKTYSGF